MFSEPLINITSKNCIEYHLLTRVNYAVISSRTKFSPSSQVTFESQDTLNCTLQNTTNRVHRRDSGITENADLDHEVSNDDPRIEGDFADTYLTLKIH